MKYRFYNRPLSFTIIFILFYWTGAGHADGTSTAGEAEAPHYLAPEEITREDYDMMSEYAYRYDSCMNQTSIEQMNNQQDPRHVVDYAMKQCAPVLEELDRKLTERNIDPAYRQGFIGNVNRHAVSNALRNVMMGMAARQSQTPEPAP